MSKKEENA